VGASVLYPLRALRQAAQALVQVGARVDVDRRAGRVLDRVLDASRCRQLNYSRANSRNNSAITR
jgi:hypothetical protein